MLNTVSICSMKPSALEAGRADNPDGHWFKSNPSRQDKAKVSTIAPLQFPRSATYGFYHQAMKGTVSYPHVSRLTMQRQ